MSNRPFKLITRRKSIALLCAGAASSFANAFYFEPSRLSVTHTCMDCTVLRRTFEKHGISFLINRNTHISPRGESMVIAATDHVWLGKPNPELTFRGIRRDTPVISLVHEPDYFDTMSKFHPVVLQVSGHTHGGQCRVPIIGFAPARVAYGKKYLQGAYERGDARLFVSRGLGTTGIRVRFACPPEVAILTLRSV